MKFRITSREQPKIGDTKTELVFLNLPKRYNDYIHWLEYVKEIYEYRNVLDTSGTGVRMRYHDKWILIETITL